MAVIKKYEKCVFSHVLYSTYLFESPEHESFLLTGHNNIFSGHSICVLFEKHFKTCQFPVTYHFNSFVSHRQHLSHYYYNY